MARYDERTALIVVDMQNDFADPKGALYVRDGERILPVVNHEIERAAADGALVVYTRDWHPPSTPHFAKDGGIWPVHCVRDTWGSEYDARLLRTEGGEILKGVHGEDGYSGFSTRDPVTGEVFHTELEALLRQRDIKKVVVVGIATDYCVKETALDALLLNFETTVLQDAVKPVDREEGDGQRALDEIESRGGRVEKSGAPDPEFYEGQPPGM